MSPVIEHSVSASIVAGGTVVTGMFKVNETGLGWPLPVVDRDEESVDKNVPLEFGLEGVNT